jgi:D-beta-D-heptose 7-phosphate kinase/D-beta-D-heptose 1-phosphate adenosyltransferase
MNILVIGDSCKDVFHYGTVNRLAPEAPVPVFNTDYTIENFGMAGNVFRNVQSVLTKEKFVGWKVDLESNLNWQDVKKIRFVEDKSNYMFLRVDENDNKFNRLNVNNLYLMQYQLVIISDYNKGCLLEEDIKYITENHPLTIVDTKKKLGDWVKNATCIKVNSIEYQQSKNYIDNNLIDKTVITLGKQGCSYRNKIYSVPEVAVKDVAGAGDSFLAAFSVFFVNTRSIQMSIVKGNDYSTLAVQKRGVSTL